MDNQQAVVDQIVQNLAFEVEAVPKNKSIQATSISQSTPLNVKIKVRKKDEMHKQHDVSSIADDTPRPVQKIRLVNSDRTIMTFDVFMEAEFEKKPSRNLRKHIFDMLRPGMCLGAVDDDEYPYMPSSSYSANITEPSVAIKSDGTLKQTFTLSKNVYQDYSVSTQPGEQKWLFGKCKPGGCLDPPFSEDKYSYKPSTRSGPERGGEELLDEEDVRSDIYSKKIPITLHDEEVKSNGRHSSIFDSGLFKKKRKSSDKSTNTKLPDKTDSIVDIYQGESATNSVSTHSNSIITYPPKVRSDPKICDDKTVRSRGPSEEKSRKSFNDHSEPYFIRPKGVNRIKEKETLDPSDYPKHRSSDAPDLRNSLKESFKMPVPLPIPIPVPIPIMSNKRKPEVIATNDNILKTQGDSANVTELDAIPDQNPQDQKTQDAINLKDTDMPTRLLRDTSAIEDTGDKLVESSKIAILILSNVEQPITPNDENKIKLQTLKEIDSENNINAQPNKKTKTEPLKMPVPVPVPFIFSDTNSAAALDSKMINDNSQRSKLKLTQSKQLFETKTTPPTTKDTPFEESKDMQQNIDPEYRSGKSESTATPKSHYSDIKADAIPYLRTRGNFSDQESDTENPVTIAPKMEKHTKRDSKGEQITEELEKSAKQNDIKHKDTTSAAPATAAIAAAAAAAMAAAAVVATTTAKKESSDIYEMPDMDTQQITGNPKKDETKDSQRTSLSKLPILIKSISILSGSKTLGESVKDKTNRSDSPDKHLDNIGHIDSDLGVHKDKKRTPLSSGPTSAALVKDKTKRSDSPDKHWDSLGHRDTDLGVHKDEKRSSLSSGPTSAALVKDKTKRSDSPDKHLDSVRHRDSDLGVHKDKKRTSPSSRPTSVASVKDQTKRSDSPDKYLDNIGHRDSDLGVHEDKKRTSLSSTPTLAASDKGQTKRSDSPDKHLDNVGHRDTDLGVHEGKKQTSLSSTPKLAASGKDQTKRSDSPDKHLDNFGHRDTDLGVHKDEKRTSLSSGPTSAASVKDTKKRSDRPYKHLDNVGHRDTDLSVHKDEKSTSVSSGVTSAALVKDKTKRRDSPDKHLDNVGHRDSDLGVHEDKKRTSLSSTPTLAASGKDQTKRSDSPDKHLDNVGHRDTDLGGHEDKKRTSLSSGPTSAASVKDQTKRSDSPDKHFENVGHKDIDLGVHKGEKQTSLSSGPILASSVKDKTKRRDSPDKHLDNVGHRDSDLGVHEDKKRTSLSGRPTSAASVKDKTKRRDSPDKHLDNFGHRDSDLSVHKDKKRTSLSSTPTLAASGKDQTKRSDSPDKHLDNVGHRDSDLGVHEDKKRTSLSSTPTLAASGKDQTKRSDSPDKHLDNIGYRDTDLGVHEDKKRTSLSSGPTSAAPVKDQTKRSDSPDKHLENVGHRDTDLGVYKGEKRTSLSSGPISASSVKYKTKRRDSPDKHLDNVGHRDSDSGVHEDKKRTSLSGRLTSAASVKDKTKRRDSPDKHLDNFGHRDSDLSVHEDKKRTSLSSTPTLAASGKDQTKRSDSPDKHLDNVGYRDTDLGIHKGEKRTSLSNALTSAASGKDQAKRSDRPNKYLDNVGHRDIHLDVLKDDKRTYLSSGPKYEIYTRDTKISEPPGDKEYDNTTEKPNNDGYIDFYTESQARFTDEGTMNLIAAPVIIDNIEPTANFQPLKEVYSETNLVGEPMNTGHEFDPSGVPITTQIVPRFRKFDEDDGTVSRELIGTKSIIYDTEEYIPTTSAKKNAESILSSDKRVILPVDTVIPFIQSTTTLKSAMKKDSMSVELGFHSYLNDKNERILQTFDAANAPKRLPNDSVTVIKSQIRISSNEIRIPVDSEHDMSIQIKKANANQRVSISESGFVNIIDSGRVKKQKSPVQCNDAAEMRSSEAKPEVRKDKIIESNATDDHFIDYYEQELVPLQLIIKNLRDEIDVLAAQQLIFKDKLFCANKSKLPRLVHSNKKCFGCVRK